MKTPKIVRELKSFKTLEYFKNYREKWEENVFWTLVFIFQELNYRVIFKDDFPKLMSMMKSFEGRMKEKAPEVYKYLDLVNVNPYNLV